MNNPEELCEFIAKVNSSNAYRDTFVKSYNYYVKFNGLLWEKPKYKSERKIPKIPSAEALMKVISAIPKKYATIFRILMETGLMPFELANVSLNDIDWDKGTVAARGFEGHSSRAFKLKSETLVMLKEYIQRYYREKPFPDSDWMGKIWRRIRNRTAERARGGKMQILPPAIYVQGWHSAGCKVTPLVSVPSDSKLGSALNVSIYTDLNRWFLFQTEIRARAHV